jgi:PEP-CTERM putative exosortase interaction domain
MMKTMMTMVTVALATVAVHAASINWQSGTMYLPVGTGATPGTWSTASTDRVPGGTGSNVTAYYFILDATTYASINLTTLSTSLKGETSLSASTVVFGTTTLADATYKVTPATTTRASNVANEGSYAIGESGYMLAVFVLDNYNLGSTPTDWFIVNKGSATISESGATATVGILAASIGVWTPVPEPTSMAFMALGVAALGLRRRFRG